ncbi:MAG TPA: permease [Kouleothrix sp.]|nr:permease [Kouleothrix sp.]
MAHTLTKPSLRPTTGDRRIWLLIGGATLLWICAYNSIQFLANWMTYELFGISKGSHFGESVAFFIYDVPKILLLLSGMIFAISTLRSFFSPERTRQLLGGKREGIGNVLASGLGVLTPFCSCSAVPLFIGFVESGIPLGVTFSFLIAAPMVNEVALAMLFGMFGWKIAALYLGAGLSIAVIAGIVIGRLKLEHHVEDFVWKIKGGGGAVADHTLTWAKRFTDSWRNTREIVGKVWLYVVIGIAVGAGIHGYVPEKALADILGKDSWWSVPAAVIIGVPLYSNAAGIIPVVQALMSKGAALGTVLAFMMSVVALSLPELIILRRVLKPRLIATFVMVVALGIIAIGYLFNLLI